MDPKKDPARRCLKVEEWPRPDQLAWRAILRKGDLLDDDVGAAAHWAPDTVHKNRRGYGRWLNHFRIAGRLDETTAPADRVTPENVRAYLAELRATGVSPFTLRNRIGELHAVIRAIAPDRDWSWLCDLHSRLNREAYPVQSNPALAVTASEVHSWGRALMDAAEANMKLPPRRCAVRFRDGLFVVLLITCPAMRRRNVAAITIDRHLRRGPNGYRLAFLACERKGRRRPYEDTLPHELNALIDRYLAVHRPRLLGGNDSNRLWISSTGRPMSDQSIYHSLTKITKRAFGVSLSPHDFRYIAGTSIAIHDPAHVGTAAPVLDHAAFKTSDGSYILANAGVASRRLGETIRAARAEARQRSRRKRRK
jgi:hypothetical protein